MLGLKGSLAGLAVAIAIIADAILDPLIGSYSDSFRGPLGRRHTLMFAAILPTSLFVWLLFDAPAGLGQAGLFAWMLTFCLLARMAGSFYSVPAAAVAAELTENATVRAELGIWRQAVTSAVQLGLTWLLFNYAFLSTEAYRNGQENPANYGRFALIVTAVLLLAALIGAFGTLKPLQAFERARVAVRPQLFSVKASLLATWRAMVDQRNFRAMFFGLLFAGVMGSYFRALNLHLGTYFWSLSTAQTGAWLMSVQVATFVAAIASRLLVGKVEPKMLYISGVATLMLASRWAAAGNDTELFVAPDMPHGFLFFPCALTTRWFEHSAKWFERVLGYQRMDGRLQRRRQGIPRPPRRARRRCVHARHTLSARSCRDSRPGPWRG